MISINATLIVQVIHFLILVLVLNRLMFRPILKLINDRSQYMETTKDKIKDIQVETERLKSEYLAMHNEARKNASKERSQMRSTGITEAEKLLNESRRQVTLIRAEADRNAEREIKQNQPLLRGEAVDLAEQIIERVIGRRSVA